MLGRWLFAQVDPSESPVSRVGVGVVVTSASLIPATILLFKGLFAYHTGSDEYWKRGGRWGLIATGLSGFCLFIAGSAVGLVSQGRPLPDQLPLAALVVGGMLVVFAGVYAAAIKWRQPRRRPGSAGEARPAQWRHVSPAAYAAAAGTLLVTGVVLLTA
ncbi:hypothetical protein OEB99_13095 [Actinotalea sp. M2MS4P-6]|uniref:hypothetical protein n=1 Tax=Actinotalea sp. M2MS4P-6 TaxID=2983762 RepID=UPI0021E3CBFF|nr:hypothetical protein [Actinotalea sp. M2MS4P-6]MCV2395248.1 hypothetical protein [Actinotalea sp. M2MS4P-6]